MFKHYFKGIEGIASYPLVLLIVFLLFFTGMVIYLWKADKLLMKKMGEMPLTDETINSNDNNSKNTSGL